MNKFPYCCVHTPWSVPPHTFRAANDPDLLKLLEDLAHNAKEPYYSSAALDALTLDQLAEKASVRAALASVYRRLLPLFLRKPLQ